MNNQTIIELREADPSSSNHDIADWETTINDRVVLKSGDSVSLKGVFVDSVAQNSGRITLDPDDINAPAGTDARDKTTISISFCYYLNNWGTSKGNLNDQAFIPAAQTYESGRNFVLCDRISLGGAPVAEITGISFDNQPDGGFNPAGHHKNTTDPVLFFYQYKNPAGVETKLEFGISAEALAKIGYTGDGSGKNFIIDQKFLNDNPTALQHGNLKFPFLAIFGGEGTDFDGNILTIADEDGTFTLPDKFSGTSGDIATYQFYSIDPKNMKFSDVDNTDGDCFQPRIITQSFKLDARDYAPDELAREISAALTQTESELYIADANALVDNPLFTTTLSLQAIGDAVVDNSDLPAGMNPVPAGNINTPPVFTRDDGGALMNFVPDCDNYVIGTTQFDLEFNENIGAEGIFQIVSMNTPLLDGDGSNAVFAIDKGVVAAAGGQRVKFLANKNGGILLTDLKPLSLWKDQMKFDTSKLLTKFQLQPKKTLDALTNIRVYTFDVTDGENATGSLKSIDVPFNKAASFDLAPTFNGLTVKSPLQRIINASDSLDDGSAPDSGYYLVEITSNFFTDKKGATLTKTNIMGIVSRFYQQNSFTSSIDGEGTFEYIHQGEPLQLSSFRCRILTPEHALAQGLKSNNTIFLQVNRASPNV